MLAAQASDVCGRAGLCTKAVKGENPLRYLKSNLATSMS